MANELRKKLRTQKENEIRENMCKIIEQYLDENHMKQVELARMVGRTNANISNFLNLAKNDFPVSMDFFIKIVENLRVSPNKLYGWDDSNQPDCITVSADGLSPAQREKLRLQFKALVEVEKNFSY